MSEKVLADTAFYLFGTNEATILVHSDSSIPSIGYQSSISEIAECLGLHAYVWPDGSGFALNFPKVAGVHEIKFGTEADGTRFVHMPTLDAKTLPSTGYQLISLPNIAPVEGGAGIVFDDQYILLLPVLPHEIEMLRNGSVQLGRAAQNHGWRPQPGLH